MVFIGFLSRDSNKRGWQGFLFNQMVMILGAQKAVQKQKSTLNTFPQFFSFSTQLFPKICV